MTSIEAVKQSLHWQEHVAQSAETPEQKQRCLDRAARLRAQLKALQDAGVLQIVHVK